jgi:dihydroorotate dehydrogenase
VVDAMPDWFYRTISRPALFRLSAERSRDLALGLMGTLARLPLGPALIDFLGHMRPPEELARSVLGVHFPAPIGLGIGVDDKAVALPALARFGFGFLEVGPVTIEPITDAKPITRLVDQQALWYPEPPSNPGLARVSESLARAGLLSIPRIVRLGYTAGATPEQASNACSAVVQRLAPVTDVFSLATTHLLATGSWSRDQWLTHLEHVLRSLHSLPIPTPLMVCLGPDWDVDLANWLVGAAVEKGVAGLVVDGGIRADRNGTLIGSPAREPTLRMVRHLRERWRDLPIIASGGVREPEHALDLFTAGASLVQIDSGLIYSGPGLPKRINEAILHAETNRHHTTPAGAALRLGESTWFWTGLMGIGMLIGGIVALLIAATRVVLPYDEEYVRMSRDELARVNDRLLAFMAHDRVSLAGTMIAIGVLYLGLSYFGIRRGLHWAKVAVLTSAFSGFGTFFFFLGFGYFDPFHAFVTVVLFQFLLLALHSRLSPRVDLEPPNLREDWRWRWSQWGQLFFIVHGAMLVGGGCMISTIGMTTVFVHEDLEFMRTTAAELTSANPRILPLVAHDRASFGGMLIASGLAVLLPSLWGFRQGQRWLWWTLLASGLPSYVAGISVHLAVGYTDWFHLTPALGGLAMLLVSLGLSYPYLCQRDTAHRESWARYLT